MAGLTGKVALITGAAHGAPASRPAALSLSATTTSGRRWGAQMHLPPLPPACASPPSAGIGLACAQSLGRAGAKVMLADVDAEALGAAQAALAAEGVEAAGVACDVGDTASVEAAVAAAVARFGGLDVAVANAGIVRSADFLEMTEADFDAVIRVNLKGAFLTGQAAARQMRAQGRGGAIVNMSSVNGVTAIPTIAG